MHDLAAVIVIRQSKAIHSVTDKDLQRAIIIYPSRSLTLRWDAIVLNWLWHIGF